MLKIVFDGEPVPQQRPRMFTRANRNCVYDPQTLTKKMLKNSAKDQMDDWQQRHGTFTMMQYPRLIMVFHMPIPKSLPFCQRSAAESGVLKHIKKPDVDNLVKLYMDVLTGILWHDDCCVQLSKCIKLYSPTPKTIVWAEEMNDTITNSELYGML